VPKRKYVLLMPLNYNDGTEVPKDILEKIYDEIFELAGGHYTAGIGHGAYRMISGKKQIDRCAEVWILIDEANIPELKRMTSRFAKLLDQESMYLESAGSSDVEFIEPESWEVEP